MFPTRAGSDYAGGSGIRQSHLKYIISAISDRFLADPIWPRCQDPYKKWGTGETASFRWQFAQIQGEQLASSLGEHTLKHIYSIKNAHVETLRVFSWMVWHQQLHHFSHVALSQRAKNILNLQLPILSTFIDLKWRKRFFPKTQGDPKKIEMDTSWYKLS